MDASGTAIEAPVSRAARKAMWGSAIGYGMDGFDLLILTFIQGAIVREWNLSATAGLALASWTLFGAMVGGFLFGTLSDRYGRVRVLSWTIILFAVFTGLCALAQNYTQLVIARTIAGLGLGGEFGIGMALAAEAWPASKRARVSSYVGLGWQAGVLIATLLTPRLLPEIGWRGMFLVGIFPALVAFAIRRSLHDPRLFTERRARSEAQSLRLLVIDGPARRASLAMLILCSVQNFGYFGVMIWLPGYLSRQFGYSLTQSAWWTAVTIGGMALGIFLFGIFADRVGRRPAFLTYMVGAAVMVVIYSRLTDQYALLVGGAVMGFFVNGMLGGYGALMSELYPTAARATAQNVLFNIGRGIGGLGPVYMGVLAGSNGFSTAIALLAVLYIIDIVAFWFLIPERRGAALA